LLICIEYLLVVDYKPTLKVGSVKVILKEIGGYSKLLSNLTFKTIDLEINP